MGNAFISRPSNRGNINVLQTTGTSQSDVMPQNACTSSFSLLGHSHSANDIVSDILSVARGGTGCSSLTSGNILLGNGTSAITSTSVLAQSKGGTGTSSFYEKGTWTPVIGSTGSTAPSVSYGYRYGSYYRVGNLVFVGCHINMNISSVGSNYACIKGLPYKCGGDTDKYGLSLVEEYYAVENGDGDPRGLVIQGTTQIHIKGHSGAGAINWKKGSGQYIGYCGCYIKT
ncbi:MAG: hypothetical protein IJI84_06180 [Clostridia bacterium]|nr:hypothetical protein [Clostridia bacterium]